MRKKNKAPIVLSAPMSEISRIVPEGRFQQFSFWRRLNGREQDTIKQEGTQLASAMLTHGASALVIGEHLTKIQAILEPHSVFGKFLRGFNFTPRTAYRYITGYKNAAERLPDPILRAAMARGQRVIGYTDERPLGIYTEAVKILPPPRNVESPQDANRYLDQLEKTRREHRTAHIKAGAKPRDIESLVSSDPEALRKELYRKGYSILKKLRNSRSKRNLLDDVVGMWLTDLGIGSQQAFKPQAIPEGFKAERGRPRLTPREDLEEAA